MTWQPDPDRVLLGLAASRRKWPHGEYEFVLPHWALPLYYSHETQRFTGHGPVDASIGTCRLFTEVDGQGLVVLAEIGADHPTLAWEVVSERRPDSLSIGYCLDPQDDGPTRICLKEVSLTDQPGDTDARVLSTGRLALRDWELLTGESIGGSLQLDPLLH